MQNLGLNLPFVLGFLWIATAGAPSVRDVVLIVVAFVAARNAGHSFNRWSDRDLDAQNPRTTGRFLVRNPSWAAAALAFAAANAVVLGVAAYLLDPLALLLVPVALGIVLGYSYTKRVSSATTLFLGLVEAVAPAAVYVGVTGSLPPAALVAALAMFGWGTAFEILHSLGDIASDVALGLYSLPRRFGPERSLQFLTGFHALAIAGFAAFGWLAHVGPGYYVGLAGLLGATAALEAYVRGDLRRTRAAFRWHFVLAGLFLVAALASFLA